jgi:hypothetical protein
MSKKRDPVVAVLAYFENAELPLAQQALALAQAIVRKRAPRATPVVGTRRPTARLKPQAVAAASSSGE